MNRKVVDAYLFPNEVQRPTWTPLWTEAKLCDGLHEPRRNVQFRWTVETRVRRYRRDDPRPTWRPGTPLPEGAKMIICEATRNEKDREQ